MKRSKFPVPSKRHYDGDILLVKHVGRTAAELFLKIYSWSKLSHGVIIDDRKWIYNSAEEFAVQLGHSRRTIVSAIAILRANGLIDVEQKACSKWKRVNYYSINYETWNSILPNDQRVAENIVVQVSDPQKMAETSNAQLLRTRVSNFCALDSATPIPAENKVSQPPPPPQEPQETRMRNNCALDSAEIAQSYKDANCTSNHKEESSWAPAHDDDSSLYFSSNFQEKNLKEKTHDDDALAHRSIDALGASTDASGVRATEEGSFTEEGFKLEQPAEAPQDARALFWTAFQKKFSAGSRRTWEPRVKIVFSGRGVGMARVCDPDSYFSRDFDRWYGYWVRDYEV